MKSRTIQRSLLPRHIKLHTGRSAPLPKICITATGRTANELVASARRALAHSTFVELRLDWLSYPAGGVAQIPRLLAALPGAILQATCRRLPNGGHFDGSVSEQLDLLIRAADAGCLLADVEIESAEQAQSGARASQFAELRNRAAVILSFHDFKETPPLPPVIQRLRRIPADFYKIVPTATGQRDTAHLLATLAELTKGANAGDEHLRWVAFAMGDAGVSSRVLALSRGSAFVYAAPPAADASAPAPAASGQVDAETLRRRYRAEKLTRNTRLFGVLGYPVKHSIGTAVHNASLAALGIDAVYLPLPSQDVLEFRRAAREYPLAGFSITLPHKQAILRYVDRPDQLVRAVGAANTVRVRAGKWQATNSDVAGVMEPLRQRYELGTKEKLPREFSALIVGNGGAARAAIVALRGLGCRNIIITGRDPQRVGDLARQLRCGVMAMGQLHAAHFDLLIQATPVGMWPQAEASPLSAAQICADTVFDLIYNPAETSLLRLARAKGCQTISGIEMYLAQAARQFEYWTGQQAPVARMRRIALGELELMRNMRA